MFIGTVEPEGEATELLGARDSCWERKLWLFVPFLIMKTSVCTTRKGLSLTKGGGSLTRALHFAEEWLHSSTLSVEYTKKAIVHHRSKNTKQTPGIQYYLPRTRPDEGLSRCYMKHQTEGAFDRSMPTDA